MTLDAPTTQHAATVALNLALAIAVGAGLSRLWVAGGASRWAGVQGARMRFAGLAALAVAMLASACVLWLEAAAMAEVPVFQAGAAAWSMLTATHLGTASMIGMGALVVAMAALACSGHARHARRLTYLTLLGMAAFLYTRSMVSHASAEGDFSASMTADWLHLMFVCTWVGEVFVAGLLALASAPGGRAEDRKDCARYVESLSASVTVALAGIVATGLFDAWHNLGGPGALTGNPYGTTLLAKLALVMLAVMLGGLNRFIVLPPLTAALRGGKPAAGGLLRRCMIILRIEAGVLLGVLVLAAMLSSTSPPAM